MTLPGQIGNNHDYWHDGDRHHHHGDWHHDHDNNWFINVGWGYPGSWFGGYWGDGYFGDYWYGSYVRPWHHNWYHGCWNGHWSNNWYVPLAAGLTGWALGASANWGYGYNYAYTNPYYVISPEPVYDYSQPIVIYSQTAVETADAPPAPTSAEEIARQEFETALARFKVGDYVQALSSVDAAIQQVADDPIFHEFRALCLFAVGQYRPAAATLNSLLAVAPGMDWTSMSGLYGNLDDYTRQLTRLEEFVQQNGQDAAARFVLAYHFLVVGKQDLALEHLERVVQLQPQDVTAARMVTALKPPPEPEAETIPEPEPAAAEPAAEPAAAPAEAEAEPGPTTNLVGNWVATADKTKIELSVDDELNFVWKATIDGKVNELTGQMATTADSVVFETKDQGNLVGKATSLGPDKFNFLAFGALPSDKGLTFERVK